MNCVLHAACLQRSFATGIVDFGREALLSRDYLWQFVATHASTQSTRLHSALMALLAQRAAVLPHELGDFLSEHGRDVSLIQDALDVRRAVMNLPALRLRDALDATGAHSTALSAIHMRHVQLLMQHVPGHSDISLCTAFCIRQRALCDIVKQAVMLSRTMQVGASQAYLNSDAACATVHVALAQAHCPVGTLLACPCCTQVVAHLVLQLRPAPHTLPAQ